LNRSATGTRIRVGVGTPGLGAGTFAAFPGCAVPDRDLTLDMTFPKAGSLEETIQVRAKLENQH
jgi:hypothetical protein